MTSNTLYEIFKTREVYFGDERDAHCHIHAISEIFCI
jgi:hypothetical protein